jgi:hypothetical protein
MVIMFIIWLKIHIIPLLRKLEIIYELRFMIKNELELELEN